MAGKYISRNKFESYKKWKARRKVYKITLYGCDAETEFDMRLSKSEFQLLKRVEEISASTSTYQCMPTLEVVEVQDDG